MLKKRTRNIAEKLLLSIINQRVQIVDQLRFQVEIKPETPSESDGYRNILRGTYG